MKVTTVRRGPKRFAWSFSKMKNFETCPRRHFELDIRKTDDKGKPYPKEESEALTWGNEVHRIAAEHLGEGKPLPKSVEHLLKPWCDRLVADGGKVDVELQYAFTKDFAPTEWFGQDAWCRAIADVLKIRGPVALALDWKTGKIQEDSPQLAIMAQAVFCHHPEVQVVKALYVWLKDDAESHVNITRADLQEFWGTYLPRVERYRQACDAEKFPPTPNGLCGRWCDVVLCPHNGRNQ